MATGKYGDVFDVPGDRSTVLREWTPSTVLRDLTTRSLYSRLFLHFVSVHAMCFCLQLLCMLLGYTMGQPCFLLTLYTLKNEKAKRKARMLLYLMGTALGRHWARRWHVISHFNQQTGGGMALLEC